MSLLTGVCFISLIIAINAWAQSENPIPKYPIPELSTAQDEVKNMEKITTQSPSGAIFKIEDLQDPQPQVPTTIRNVDPDWDNLKRDRSLSSSSGSQNQNNFPSRRQSTSSSEDLNWRGSSSSSRSGSISSSNNQGLKDLPPKSESSKPKNSEKNCNDPQNYSGNKNSCENLIRRDSTTQFGSPSSSSQNSKYLFRRPSTASEDSANWRDQTAQFGSPSSSSQNSNNPSRRQSEASEDDVNWRDPSSRSGSFSSNERPNSGTVLRSDNINIQKKKDWRDGSSHSSGSKTCGTFQSSFDSDSGCASSNWRDSLSHSSGDNSGSPTNKFRTFIFAQSWPPGNGLHFGSSYWRNTISTNGDLPIQWTIHGLWPSWLRSSDSSDHENEMRGAIRLLRDDLMRLWPSYDLTFTYDAFWAYQYRKHGTVASEIAQVNTPLKYFEKILKLLEHYNIGKILQNLEVLPGSRIKPGELRARIRDLLGVDVIIVCDPDDVFGDQFIYEIRLCFTTDFQLTDCWGPDMCDDDEEALYPSGNTNTDMNSLQRMRLSESSSCSDSADLIFGDIELMFDPVHWDDLSSAGTALLDKASKS
ncbi:hypothetical protein QAD02_006267 [Eretmocerus hayati]|uniref:Uncharacterized protein n=1 Tax=Eretmocerus hayati TaxID=131215 RepID=A0ACC2N4K7_9HYME|nr:hypothetical protein QAD02_006267 [Eretmocerus hayati]